MSDDELERGDDGLTNEHDDENAHQVCFVFKPFAVDDLDQQQPAKKRRKTKPSSDGGSISFLPLNNGAEPSISVQIRHDCFQEVWARKRSRIEDIVSKADAAAWTQVTEFIKAPQQDETSKLHTGLLVSGPDGSAQSRLLEKWRIGQAENGSETAIQLRASHCTSLQITLKNIIKNTIVSQVGRDEYQNFLNKHKRLVPMNFDLELLEIFVQEYRVHRIILSVLDVETFDMAILSELLLALNSRSSSIPFVVLLGIATTVNLFESRLPKSVVEILEATTFRLPSSDDILQKILDDVQVDPDQKLLLGPTTISALREMTQSQGVTIDSFINAVKYAFMSSFFANSLSVLLSNSTQLQADKSLCEAIRNTSSFREHCEDLLQSDRSNVEEVSKLLVDDQYLFEKAHQMVQSHEPSLNGSGSDDQPFLQEAYLVDSRQSLHLFNPRVRHALERALVRPGDYLGCECCQSNTATNSSQAPPTAILYNLLQEAGTVINVRDLYDAFCSGYFHDETATGHDGAADEDSNQTDKAHRRQLSMFYSCLAELKMLGFVKSSTSAVVRKRALASSGGGGSTLEATINTTARGKDRNGDVDFVAKTGWAGL